MATTTPNDTYNIGIRKTLNDLGISNERIGYKNGYVTVDGSNVIKPSYSSNGTAYTDQSGLNTLKNYVNKINPVGAAGTIIRNTASSVSPATSNTQTQQSQSYYGYSNPIDTQVNSALQDYINALRNPVSVSREQAYASPEYAAQQAQAQQQAQQAIRTAQEAAGASGFGRSTVLTDRAQGIQNSANQYLETQVLPQIISQLQAREDQRTQNLASILNALTGQQSLYDTRYNTANQLAFDRASLTGTYVDPRVEELYNQILDQKNRYANATTPEERAAANTEANRLRSLLNALGVNADSMIGANVTYDQALNNRSKIGQQTLAAREQDFNQRMQEANQRLNETQLMAELTGKLPDGTPTTAEQQRQLQNLWTVADATGTIPDALADMYKLPRGMQTQAAKQFALRYALDQQAQAANIANQEAQTALDYQRFLAGSGSGSSYNGLTANQALSALRSQYSVPIFDDENNQIGTKITTDPTQRRQMINQILMMGLPDNVTDQVAAALGITNQEWKAVTGVDLGNP
jgi:uncharacterized protein YpiB (UPF0302 family)